MDTKLNGINIGDIVPVFKNNDEIIDVPSSHPFLKVSISDFINNNQITNNDDFINYLITKGLNKELINIVKKADFLAILKSKYNSSIITIEHLNGTVFYIPTTKGNSTANSIEIDLLGNIKIIENIHTPLVIDNIRFGSVNIISIEKSGNDIIHERSTQSVIPHDRLMTKKLTPCFDVSIEKVTAIINSNGVLINKNNHAEQLVCITNENETLIPLNNNSYSSAQYENIIALGFDENYFKKPKIAGVNYNHEGNEIIYDNEDLSHLLIYSPKQIEETTKINTSYIKYLEEINNILDNQSKEDYLAIEFNIDSDTCKYRLSKIISNNKKILIHEKDFPFDDSFKNELLEPSLVDFAKRSTVISSFVTPNTNNQNRAIMTSNYRAVTENNNILSINNVDNEYANNIASAIIKIPVIEPDITTVPNGYVTVIILSLISSISCGIVVGITYMLIN